MTTHHPILGVNVHAVDYGAATSTIVDWSRKNESRYVCATSVHGVIHAQEDASFKTVLNDADLITPDGMPLVWGLRLLGSRDASRVYGPELTLRVCEAAAKAGVSIALYGGTPDSIEDFTRVLESKFEGIRIATAISPPFRPLTGEEDAAYTKQIADSGAGIVLVGIGCPKQEKWMAEHRGRIPAVMLGVGAAFDFHAGRVRQAPAWIQRMGFEWFFRLLMEPRRLWSRYAKIVPQFLIRFPLQLAGSKLAARA